MRPVVAALALAALATLASTGPAHAQDGRRERAPAPPPTAPPTAPPAGPEAPDAARLHECVHTLVGPDVSNPAALVAALRECLERFRAEREGDAAPRGRNGAPVPARPPPRPPGPPPARSND